MLKDNTSLDAESAKGVNPSGLYYLCNDDSSVHRFAVWARNHFALQRAVPKNVI